MAADLFKYMEFSDSTFLLDVQRNCFYLFCYILKLFRCDPNLLLASLCTRSILTREGPIIKALDCNAAVTSRDALAKTVYARLFDWFAFTCFISHSLDVY